MDRYEEKARKILDELRPTVHRMLESGDCRLKLTTSSKVAKSSGNSFSVLAGRSFGCPGATDFCESRCYARKNRHLFWNVIKAHAFNYVCITEALKSGREDVLIQGLKEQIHTPILRIHEAGDFFSQEYVRFWERVARERPDVHFYAYTRSFHLDFSNLVKLENFTLVVSADPENEAAAEEFAGKYNIRVAYLVDKDHNTPIYKGKRAALCPLVHRKPKGLTCFKCRVCIDGRSDILFPEH